MKTIAVSELRANLMRVLKEVAHGSVVDVTSSGKVVAKIVTPDRFRDQAREKLKQVGKTAVIGDVISPVDSGLVTADKNIRKARSISTIW